MDPVRPQNAYKLNQYVEVSTHLQTLSVDRKESEV